MPMRITLSIPRRPHVALATLAAPLLLACGGDGTGPSGHALADVTITNAADTLGIADTLRLRAEPRDSSGAVIVTAAITWRSLAPAIATIGETGLLTGVDSGDVRVVVTARARTTVEDTVLVRVRPLPHAFELSGLDDTVYVSGNPSDTVRSTVRDGRGIVMSAVRLEWTSSDTSVLVVDSLGRLTGRTPGSAWLRIRAGAARDSVGVVVELRRIATPAPFVQHATPLIVLGSSCGRTAAGALWCGGSQLASPVTFVDVQMGQFGSNCGLAADSTAYCWGSNSNGQFGNDSRSITPSSTPVQAFGGRRLRRLAVGDHAQTCGILAADSVVYCVGHNDFGQVGRLPVSDRDTLLRPITGALKALDVDITGFHGCAVALDGALWCWGQRWAPNIGTDGVIPPTRLTGPGPWVQVALVDWAACLRAPDGMVECHTYAGTRQLATTARFATIVATSRHTVCGMTSAGEVSCWLPGRESTTEPIPVRRIAPGRTYASIAPGVGAVYDAITACMIDAQQRLYCF